MRNSIQLEEYSMSGGLEGLLHRVSVVNVNRNDRRWNVNANRLDNPNRWNAENRFFSRNYFISSAQFWAEVFVSINFFHPASSFPINSKFFDI